MWKKYMMRKKLALLAFVLLWAGCGDSESKSPGQTDNSAVVAEEKKDEAAKPADPDLAEWQKLVDDFYRQECEVIAALKPIYDHGKELAILEAYLPQIYTPSFCQWFIGCPEVKQLKAADPPFPIGPVKIEKVEKREEQTAVIGVSVRFQRKGSGEVGYHLYQLHLQKESGRWVIDRENMIQQQHNVTTAFPRNMFGHLQNVSVVELAPPRVDASTPRQLLDSMGRIALYIQSERNRVIARIFPPLIPKLEPFLSQNYYREISEKAKIAEPKIHIKIEEFKEVQPPEDMAVQVAESDVCWSLTLSTVKMPGEQPFRPYQYFWILKKGQDGWRLHLEIGKRIGRYPTPEPFFHNLMRWQLR